MSPGTVVLSLDFELGWGHRLTKPSYLRRLRDQGDNVRTKIKQLIDLFDKYNIPATWATVGHLVQTGDDELLHAPDLFEYLLETETNHEIGLHSFNHKPYNQLSPTAVRTDLSNGVDALEEWGKTPESFVFPQNKIDHLSLLEEHSIRCYRGEPESILATFPRGLLRPPTYSGIGDESLPARVPSSMFLAARRPTLYRRKYSIRGLARSKQRGSIVHYWLHPHNVVTDDSLLSELENLFESIRSTANAGEIQIQTMSQLTGDNSIHNSF
jgi:peptidoglycan/xylan/chitin deacetylase (PgdA/CDA1 family)